MVTLDCFLLMIEKKKMTVQSWVILRMNKDSSVEAIDASKLSDQTKFRLN